MSSGWASAESAVSEEPRIAPIGQLREVRRSFGARGGFRRFFDLLWLISVTEFRRTYFGTMLGYLWSLIRPLAPVRDLAIRLHQRLQRRV